MWFWSPSICPHLFQQTGEDVVVLVVPPMTTPVFTQLHLKLIRLNICRYRGHKGTKKGHQNPEITAQPWSLRNVSFSVVTHLNIFTGWGAWLRLAALHQRQVSRTKRRCSSHLGVITISISVSPDPPCLPRSAAQHQCDASNGAGFVWQNWVIMCWECQEDKSQNKLLSDEWFNWSIW